MKGRKKEIPYILCSAIYYQDGEVYLHQPKNIHSGIVICGRRHHNCFNTLFAFVGDAIIKSIIKQGFLTSDDIFVNRFEAFEIAKASKQISAKRKASKCIALISEDLW